MLRNVEAMPEVWDFDEDAPAGVNRRCNRLRLDRALSIALGERVLPRSPIFIVWSLTDHIVL